MRASAASALLFFVDRIFFHTWRTLSARFSRALLSHSVLQLRATAPQLRWIPGSSLLFAKKANNFAVLLRVRHGGQRSAQIPAEM